jgi:hypothetical protein
LELAIELNSGAEDVPDLLAPANKSDATDNRAPPRAEENNNFFAAQQPFAQYEAHSTGGNIDSGNR